jgi:hypothetical protein
LQATAYDAAGNQGNSSKITVTVANDTIAPKVTMISPVGGAVVSGNIAISVSATDNTKVAQISLLIDGKQVAVSYGSQLSYAWSATTAPAGSSKSKKRNATTIQAGSSHTITARARIQPAIRIHVSHRYRAIGVSMVDRGARDGPPNAYRCDGVLGPPRPSVFCLAELS